jgi:hypothetical protein
MVLTTLDLINGLFSIIFVAISTLVGFTIASKYIKSKIRTLLFIGIAWILIVSPWWPSSASVILALATGEGLSLEMYLLLGNLFTPVFMFFLVAAFTEIYYNDKQKIILIIFAIIGILIEIYLVYFIIVDPCVLGELQGIVDIEFRGLLRIYLLIDILLVLVLGFLIALNSLRTETPEIKLRGKFLMLAFISWTVGAIADASLPLNFITLTIIRIVLITSAIEFYIGFILPDWIKKHFL